MPTSQNDTDDDTEVLSVSVMEAQDLNSRYIEFRFPPKTRFENASALFQALRDLVVDHFDRKIFWMIKMSSRVTCTNMPLLHDPTNFRVLVDILQPIRDPAAEVYARGVIRLYFFPSKSHFYRKKIHAQPVRIGSVQGRNPNEQTGDTDGCDTGAY